MEIKLELHFLCSRAGEISTLAHSWTSLLRGKVSELFSSLTGNSPLIPLNGSSIWQSAFSGLPDLAYP